MSGQVNDCKCRYQYKFVYLISLKPTCMLLIIIEEDQVYSLCRAIAIIDVQYMQ